jgi:YVTN family beta-propeller protein
VNRRRSRGKEKVRKEPAMNSSQASQRRALLAALAGLVLSAAALAAEPQRKLYILSSHGEDVTVVDVQTNAILRTIQVGKDPHGIAAPSSQDVLYIATEEDQSIEVIDPVRDVVTARYPIFGKRPNEIEVTPDGRFLYVPCLGAGEYQVFDTREKKIVARLKTDGYPHNTVVSPDGRFMYLSPYDRGATSEESVRKQGLPTSLNRKLYIADTRSHSIVSTIDVPNAPRPIALSPDGKRLYVNTDNFLGFLVVDVEKKRVLREVPYDLTEAEKAMPSRSHGIGVTPDGAEVWSCDTNNGLVHVFDVRSDPPREIARVKAGKVPYWVTLTPDGRTIYVSNTGEDTVSVIDVQSKKERTRIQVGQGKAPKRLLVLTVPALTAAAPAAPDAK